MFSFVGEWDGKTYNFLKDVIAESVGNLSTDFLRSKPSLWNILSISGSTAFQDRAVEHEP